MPANDIPQSILTPDSPIITPIQETSVESKPTVVTSSIPTKDAKLDSTRWAHLTKKETALVKERESLKKEREEFLAQKAEADTHRRAWEMVNEIANLQKTDAVAAMRKAGFSDTDMMNFLAQSQDNSTPEEKAVKLAKSEIDKFKEEQARVLEESNKKAAESQKLQEEKIISKYKSDLGKEISKEVDKYEYLNFYGDSAQEVVYNLITTIVQETPPDEVDMEAIRKEALQLTEDFYEEQDKAMNSIKKRGTKPIEQPKAPVQTPKAPTTTRTEAKQFVDNKILVRTPPPREVLTPEHMTPQQNKEHIIQKYMNMTKR